MFNAGLSLTDRLELVRTLATSHRRSWRVQITDLDQMPVAHISERILDGEVQVDWDGEEATRAATLLIFDPDFDLGFDTPNGDSGVWFLDRMVQVFVQVELIDSKRWIEIPIFTGPIRKFRRIKDVVTLDCVGKDVFARKAWPRLILQQHTNRIEGIRTVLESLGEAFFRFEAETNERFAGNQTIDRNMQASPFGWCRMQASAMGLRLYYDGAGYAVLRPFKPDEPVFTFSDGDGGTVVTEPHAEGDFTPIVNVLRAEGQQQPNGTNPFYEAVVSVDSPIHPSKLTRNGKPVWIGEVIERDSITSERNARTVAENELRDRQFTAFTTQFDALPMFLLEENDTCRLLTDGFATTFTAKKFGFGFGTSQTMPVGYKKSIAPQAAKIRRN